MKWSMMFVSLFCVSLSAQASLHGALQRFPVKDKPLYPLSAVGLVENFCSGTLIAPNKVLTAAHCLYDIETDQYMPVKTFHLGQNGISHLGQSIKVTSIKPHPIYVATGLPAFDVGIITLERAVSEFVVPVVADTMLGWDLNSETLAYERISVIAGYPGDQLLGNMWYVVCLLEKNIHNLSRAHYNCDTFGGMSGSALIVYNQSGPQIIGVHTNGGAEKNFGVLIFPELLEFIKSN
ncbi:MAG: trypsin-like serine protease [Bdellovibrionaceae bacterium]|nr:trypsin-like serine protease [Pseudobdellovibrionaceae bacterium]